jgi:hypothetical protein
MGRKERKTVSLSEFADGRDENNFAEFPLSLLTDTVPEGLKSLDFEDTMTDWKTGQTITRRVCITGSDKFGLPRPKDEDVILALVQLTKITNNFTCPEVYFTKRQLIQLLGWENRGWAYDRLEESLHRWKAVSIHYRSAWRNHARGEWCDSEAIGVIEYVKLTDSRRRPTNATGETRSRIIWNKILFDSFASGYLKRLDYRLYRSLERPAARRAYRFLDKRFHHRPDWEFELRTFACEKIGLSRTYDTGQLKQRLEPALEELERIGFIAPVTYRKERPKVWRIAISKAVGKQVADSPAVASSPAVQQLVTRGIMVETAMALVAEYPEVRINEKVLLFDWLAARQDKRVSKNPPGFLAEAIRKNYRLPRDFMASLPSSKTHSSPKLRKGPRTVATSVASDSETIDIVKYIERLSSEERAALEQQALAEASRLQVDTHQRLSVKRGKLWEELRQSILVDFVRCNPVLLAPAT